MENFEKALNICIEKGLNYKGAEIREYHLSGYEIIMTDKFGFRYSCDVMRILLDSNFIKLFGEYLVSKGYTNTQSGDGFDERSLFLDIMDGFYDKNGDAFFRKVLKVLF